MDEIVPIRTLNECFDQSEHFNFGIKDMAPKTEGKKHTREPHRHDFYYVLFIHRGSGFHTIDFKSYQIADYSVYFVSPGQVHALQLDENTEGFAIFFKPEFYLMNSNPKKLLDFPFFHTLSNEPALFLDENKFSVIQHTIRDIFDEYTNFKIGRDHVIRAYIDVLLVKLSRYYQREELAGEPLRTTYLLRELENLIDHNYISIRSATEYAEMMNISSKHLSDITRKALNKTITNLIHERIIIEAKRLLLYTDYTVSQVAYELEYLDKSYFLRFFKKNVGLTPETYRQQHLQNVTAKA
ncbi:AraC family transcriptional regulator [uncultured Aquimarina sp.]|uniref:helix-turn-helix domain-containing protein n=2 Tax=uncultured Aquimarina sp. TaxID=575652 RepID=UPI00263044F2|nr:helix-turn-helix transcriptional regulator [uncultured Aquimarina sp.]